MKKIKQILTGAMLFCASFAFANELKLGHITVSDGVAKYKNATLSGDSTVYAISVHVDKGSIVTTDIGAPTYTDTLSAHQTGIWTYNDGIGVSVAQAKVQSLAFNYEEGMTITISVDSNTTSIPSGVAVTQFTPEPAKIVSNKEGTKYTGTTIPNSGGTPHYYMFVSFTSEGLSTDKWYWGTAYNSAKTYTFLGMKGYLATITSQAEDKVLDNITTLGGWAGAARTSTRDINLFDTDKDTNLSYDSVDAAYATWNWVCGPEAGYGVRTSTGVANKEPVKGGYTEYAKWYNTSQPDYSNQSEKYFQVHFSGSGQWNDLPNVYSDYSEGYFVEFSDYNKVSGYTEPASVALQACQVYNQTQDQDYSSIADAVSNANTGDILVLMSDQVASAQDAAGKNLVLNTNGYNITGSFTVSEGSFKVNAEENKVNLTTLTVSGGDFVIDKLKCQTVNVTGGTLTINGTTSTASLTNASLSGGSFTLNGGAVDSTGTLSVSGGTFTVDSLVTIPSLKLTAGQKVVFEDSVNSGSQITLSSELPTSGGVITSGFGAAGLDLGQVINFPSGITDYMLIKNKDGELKVKQHKSAW